MSEITRGAIGMPFEMAMESELSRRQFHSIAQALLAERDQLRAENQALRKDAERWRFFSVLANDLQAFPHAWGKMTPEKMDAMCDLAMADAAMGNGDRP